MDKKELLKLRKKAYSKWAITQGKINNTRLAKETGLSVNDIMKYKIEDRWQERLEKAIDDGIFDKMIKDKIKDIKFKPDSREETRALKRILDTAQITDQQKLFVMHYLESHNLKYSAISAGYSKKTAQVMGAHLINNKRISRCIARINKLIHKRLFIKAHDVVDEYVKIAFADITHFVTFDKGQVSLKSSDEVDGRMITEVKQGRDGISLKMADKMKALERLEKLFEIIPDRKLQLDQDKFELTKELSNMAKSGATNVTIINDIGS